MIKVVRKLISNLLIPIILVGVAFCLSSCSFEMDILDLALNSLKLDLHEVDEPLYLAKQIFLTYEETEYIFDIKWTYTNQDNWNELYDSGSFYTLMAKDDCGDFDFDLTATIEYEKESKSKTFHAHFHDKEEILEGIDIVNYADDDEEITIEGIAINIYESDSFVFCDGKKGILVEIDNSEKLVYNIKIEIVVKPIRRTIKIGDDVIERVTAEYVDHRVVTGTYGEKITYSSEEYSLEDLIDISNNVSIDNYKKMNQTIVKTKGKINLQNNKYFLELEDNYINISKKDNTFLKMLLGEFIDSICTVDLFVDFKIIDGSIVDYNFSIINVYIS